MSGRFFLDTNIFVYSFDRSAPEKCGRAQSLIQTALEKGAGVTSYQTVQEFFNVATRKFSHPMTLPEAEQYLAIVFRPILSVQSSVALHAEALRLAHRFKLPFYDALIAAGALESECRILYSEDFQHGMKIGNLQVVNPFL